MVHFGLKTNGTNIESCFLTSFFQVESCQWIADRTAAPLQKGIINLIYVPLILNHCFIFLIALMRVITQSENFRSANCSLYQYGPPCIFFFTNHKVKMSAMLIKRFNFTQNLKNMCPLTVYRSFSLTYEFFEPFSPNRSEYVISQLFRAFFTLPKISDFFCLLPRFPPYTLLLCDANIGTLDRFLLQIRCLSH